MSLIFFPFSELATLNSLCYLLTRFDLFCQSSDAHAISEVEVWCSSGLNNLPCPIQPCFQEVQSADPLTPVFLKKVSTRFVFVMAEPWANGRISIFKFWIASTNIVGWPKLCVVMDTRREGPNFLLFSGRHKLMTPLK